MWYNKYFYIFFSHNLYIKYFYSQNSLLFQCITELFNFHFYQCVGFLLNISSKPTLIITLKQNNLTSNALYKCWDIFFSGESFPKGRAGKLNLTMPKHVCKWQAFHFSHQFNFRKIYGSIFSKRLLGFPWVQTYTQKNLNVNICDWNEAKDLSEFAMLLLCLAFREN